LLALVLFITEVLATEIISLILISTLVLSGVISPEQGVAGFSNNATITVMFMFVISGAILKTGALQQMGFKFSGYFKNNFNQSMIIFMVLIAFCSAWMNNTPVVAVFIPIVLQIARNSGNNPTKMLMPLSFATIFGGTCTLIGTSTNVLVSGILEKSGLEPISMFDMTPMGLVLLVVGILYMVFIGNKLLPDRKPDEEDNNLRLAKDYVTEIILLDQAVSAGKTIMDSPLVKAYEMDIIEISRMGEKISLPSGDFVLWAGDRLKVRCSVEKLKLLKEKLKTESLATVKIAEHSFDRKSTSLVELIITAKSDYAGKTLRDIDFRRSFRAVPIAIKHREEVVSENLYETKLQSGDVILAEVKSHFVKNLKQQSQSTTSPFILISEESFVDFNKKNFVLTMSIVFTTILVASFEWIPIMPASIAAVCLLLILKCINPKEMLESVEWNVVFLLAGTLALGEAMKVSGLADTLAGFLADNFGQFGPWVLLSAFYLFTSLLTEIMSNNATAALLVPIGLSLSQQLGVSYVPFIMAITFGASASFMTPIGYQTNAMVYGAGNYKFKDFLKVGTMLNMLFWLTATLLIPVFYPF